MSAYRFCGALRTLCRRLCRAALCRLTAQFALKNGLVGESIFVFKVRSVVFVHVSDRAFLLRISYQKRSDKIEYDENYKCGGYECLHQKGGFSGAALSY